MNPTTIETGFPLREHLGVGIPEMFLLMRERGLPEPTFRIDGGHFRVVLRTR